jgi:hypothetical protein
MSRNRIGLLVAVVVFLASVAGCTGAPGSGGGLAQTAADFLPAGFVLQLPRMYVQYVETADGGAEPAVSGIGASVIEAWFGMDLSTVKIPPFYVDWIKASDVQHIEVVTGSEGILAYVNGKPTPYLAWDADSIGLAAELTEAFGIANVSQFKSALPWLQRIGLDVVVQMPLAAGADIIRYRDLQDGLLTSTAPAEIEAPDAEVKLGVSFDENGVPSLAGVSASALQPFIGYTPGQLDPQYIALVKQSGIQRLTVQTRGDGLFIFVNDRPLPHLAWSKDHLMTAVNLYAEMNETSWMANETFVNMVSELVLKTTNSDIELVVDFP